MKNKIKGNKITLINNETIIIHLFYHYFDFLVFEGENCNKRENQNESHSHVVDSIRIKIRVVFIAQNTEN